jgi:hypothetical protein
MLHLFETRPLIDPIWSHLFSISTDVDDRIAFVTHSHDGTFICHTCQKSPHHVGLFPPCEHIKLANEQYCIISCKPLPYYQVHGPIQEASDIELQDRREHPEWFIPRNSITGDKVDQVRAEAYEETARRGREAIEKGEAVASLFNTLRIAEGPDFSWHDIELPTSEPVKQAPAEPIVNLHAKRRIRIEE